MPQMYYDKDADLGLLNGKRIGVIGFGSQGHAHALNLKDSGCDVAVGLYPGSRSWKAVEESGLRVGTVNEVAEQLHQIRCRPPPLRKKATFNGVFLIFTKIRTA